MNQRPDESGLEEGARRESAQQGAQNHISLKQPGYLLVAWMLLLLLGAFFLFASVSDLVADGRSGLPSDHLEAFHTIAGVPWASAKRSSPKITQYVTLRRRLTVPWNGLSACLPIRELLSLPALSKTATLFQTFHRYPGRNKHTFLRIRFSTRFCLWMEGPLERRVIG